jgi:hypothetical protein
VNVTRAAELGAQTASEDFAERDGAPYDAAYLRSLAQRWALRHMFSMGADVPTAKQWEATFTTSYTDTYAALTQAEAPQEKSEG